MSVGLVEVLLFLGLINTGDTPGGGGGGGGGTVPPPVPPPPPGPGYPGTQPAPAPAPAPAPFPGLHINPAQPKPAPAPSPAPAPAPSPHLVIRPPTPQPGPWPAPVKPATLPPFPGPGWKACAPLSAAIIARAQFWNPQLWNYGTQTIKKPYAQEQLGGQWITFAAAWHPDSSGTPHKLMATEAWCLASPGPSPGPAPTPSQPLNSGVAPVGPEPELGGWQTDAAFVKRYQNALSYLSFTKGKPAWNTKGVDGGAGPNTQAAVRAFQTDNGISPVDGECGSATASVIDTLLGYPVPPGGYPPPGGGGSAPADPGDPSAYNPS